VLPTAPNECAEGTLPHPVRHQKPGRTTIDHFVEIVTEPTTGEERRRTVENQA